MDPTPRDPIGTTAMEHGNKDDADECKFPDDDNDDDDVAAADDDDDDNDDDGDGADDSSGFVDPHMTILSLIAVSGGDGW
mmetsp:Transcript_40753/g.79414  ORF Transcript_40753/g.79414 Transcript_40753/m.79414 type:complete len:80 (-) Transcript_40753:55-294(-)